MRASTPNNPRVDENNDVLATLRVEAYFQLNSAKTQIKITKVHATVKQRASYAIIQSRTAGACQGPQFAQIKTQNFNTNETTITTGWGYIPFMSYSESNGLVCNGGMVESGVTSVGMGDTVLRAEAYV